MTNLLRFWKYYFAVSGTLIMLAVTGLVLFKLRPGLDFTGGSVIEIEVTGAAVPSETEVESLVQDVVTLASVQRTPTSVILKATEIDQDMVDKISQKFSERYQAAQVLRFESVGPVLGQELIRKTVIAIALGALGILSFLGYRFRDVKYGACAIVAMFHDLIILIGIFSWLGHFAQVEVDSLFVTAVLTILSFSVHDTIVLFDRIRELNRLHPKASFVERVNKAIAETLARSVNNSMTIIFMLLALFLLGGESVRWFAFALLCGTVVGTYSSTFTAAPLLVIWQGRFSKKSQ